MMEKYNFNQIFKDFEPELIEEIESLQQMEIPKGQGNLKDCDIIPELLSKLYFRK